MGGCSGEKHEMFLALLRSKEGLTAALAGGLICLALLPVAPAGVPIIASVFGVAAALRSTRLRGLR